MNTQDLENFKTWFYDYVSTFYKDDSEDEIYNDNIKLKECHTKRVCADMLLIAEQLGLSADEKMIAETIALFHDVGRFEQFKRFRSYNDVGTINHALLGLEILTEQKMLAGLDSRQRQIIEDAIRFHGDKDMPKHLDKETDFFARLIRDVDKLDIYYVMVELLNSFGDDSEKYMTTFGYRLSAECSEHIIDAVINNETIDYKDFKSTNDMIIAQLGWVADINFVPTLEAIRQRGYFDELVKFLPDSEPVRCVTAHIYKQIESRVS